MADLEITNFHHSFIIHRIYYEEAFFYLKKWGKKGSRFALARLFYIIMAVFKLIIQHPVCEKSSTRKSSPAINAPRQLTVELVTLACALLYYWYMNIMAAALVPDVKIYKPKRSNEKFSC